MDSLGDYKRKKGRGELERKLTDLEKQMRDLHDKLMEEKLKLSGAGGDLPKDWPSMNRLHLPHCPMVRRTTAAKYNPDCAVHGAHASPPGFLSCPVEYAKKLSQAEEECREVVRFVPDARPPSPVCRPPSPPAETTALPPSPPPLQRREEPSASNKSEGSNTEVSSEEEYVPYSAVKKASQELFNIEDYVQTAISKLRV